MPSEDFLFSVIIPTYNRADEIGELLKSLIVQTLSPEKFEVIVVDDGSTDNTLGIIESFKINSDIRIAVINQDHKGPGAARNLGMKHARGKYFVFIDSDCIADPNWLSSFEEAVAVKEVGGFGGPDGVLKDFLPIQKAIDYSMTSFITTGGIRGHSKKKISKYYPRSFNMGVRADIVEKIGGMGKLRPVSYTHLTLPTTPYV
jgi:glycosyltransferase involved in cell wall biosynthesis